MRGLLGAVNVEPRVAHQGDLVEDGAVDAEIISLVSALVATMENLALGVNVGVEARLSLGGAFEAGLGNGVVGGVLGVLAVEEGGDLGGVECRLEEIPHVLSLGLGVSLGGHTTDESEEDDGLHGGGVWVVGATR